MWHVCVYLQLPHRLVPHLDPWIKGCFFVCTYVSQDMGRLEDCKQELHSLLKEERLFGATLLVLANKHDLPSALSLEELHKVGGWKQMWHQRAPLSATDLLHMQACRIVLRACLLLLLLAVLLLHSQALDLQSITKRHCYVVSCSAVSGEGVLKGFDWLVRDISSRIYMFD